MDLPQLLGILSLLACLSNRLQLNGFLSSIMVRMGYDIPADQDCVQQSNKGACVWTVLVA